MTSKVLPLVSDHSVCPLSPHQRDSKGMRGSTDSVEHYDESVDVHLVHNEEIAWIRENIKMRCTSTTSKDKANDVCSTCRNKNSDHEPIACSQQKQEAMSPSAKDTYQYRVPTNAFGEIEFVGFGNIGKFIRVDIKINRNTLLDLMEKEWGTETPNLIISVTGSAKYSSMKPDLRDVFQRGLMKAARSTGAWIVTGGTYTGVMKYVGEAVQEYGLTSATQKPVVAIGIAPWGIIRNRNNLENNKGSWPAQYRIEKHLNRKESFLDPNHSHFILVDDGTQNTFETEIPFRAKLERKMSRRKNDTGDDNRVPIVILVLEGGKGTLKTVHQALKKHTPAVIVKGSGRAADILAYAFNRFTAEDKHKEGQHCKR